MSTGAQALGVSVLFSIESSYLPLLGVNCYWRLVQTLQRLSPWTTPLFKTYGESHWRLYVTQRQSRESGVFASQMNKFCFFFGCRFPRRSRVILIHVVEPSRGHSLLLLKAKRSKRLQQNTAGYSHGVLI